ncbi:MAG TPA: N-acetylmuramoyl-L-alanine amidase-like domain-containing protein [Tepidisphaeraceae bacterium]|nr:N-acetylmuramoyl-L-alanine amidase-like domain-containing protein [Tepidisphaeraceae bacterium]
MKRIGVALIIALGVFGCQAPEPTAGPAAAEPTAEAPTIERLKAKPLYAFTEREVDAYLRHLSATEPDLRRRIVHLARKNLEQPYELYLLGEAPFEQTDPQPIYCLDRSDCVVFAEHTLAIALSNDFPSFMSMLQRIRYKDGQIGVVTRNHYTEADWNVNNRWLLTDVTNQLGGDAVKPFSQKVDRAKFFKTRYKLDESMPVETIQESFIPYERIDSVKPLLRDGDVVNFVTGKGDGYWVGHVGLVAHAPDGTVNLIHSAKPKVREEPIDAYIARMTKDAAADDAAGEARFRGFKFLRLTDDPLANLRAIDGPQAPVVKLPPDSAVTWDKYLESFNLGG